MPGRSKCQPENLLDARVFERIERDLHVPRELVLEFVVAQRNDDGRADPGAQCLDHLHDRGWATSVVRTTVLHEASQGATSKSTSTPSTRIARAGSFSTIASAMESPNTVRCGNGAARTPAGAAEPPRSAATATTAAANPRRASIGRF
jgi:hypothetical protein